MSAPVAERALDALVSSLLRETWSRDRSHGAVENGFPGRSGLLLPADYACEHPGAFDHLQLECVAIGSGGATLTLEVRYLQPGGERDGPEERRVSTPVWTLDSLALAHRSLPIPADSADLPPRGRIHVAAEELAEDLWFIGVRVENLTRMTERGERMERAAALRHALHSTHVLLRLQRGRFLSPDEPEGPAGALASRTRNVNTWPILAGEDAEVLLGSAIPLTDLAAPAPESRS
jgi:hypothetical protein